jgi:hypothetical protein
MSVNILIVNASSILPNKEVAAYVPIMQAFDDEALRPAWNLEPATYGFQPWGKNARMPAPTKDLWPIFLNNRSDQAGALGWHDDRDGLIFGRCFVGDCKRYNLDWRTDVTHEAWELRVDPQINRQVKIANDALGRERIAAVEVCDAVEDDLYAIKYKGSRVSNFVLPAYYDNATGPYDYGHVLLGPVPTVMSGGYQSIFVGNQWTQIVANREDGSLPYRLWRPGGRGGKRVGLPR